MTLPEAKDRIRIVHVYKDCKDINRYFTLVASRDYVKPVGIGHKSGTLGVKMKKPRMSSKPNCHDDGHVFGKIVYVQDGRSSIDVCLRCHQTREQVASYEARKRQEATP